MTTEKSNRKIDWSILVIALLLLGSIYIGGYFSLGKSQVVSLVSRRGLTDIMVFDRKFRHHSLVTVFRPMGWVESKLRNGVVIATGPYVAVPDREVVGEK